ncbi:pretranslocase SecA subunit-like domain protein [Orientia tsutsugamushi str. UT76]|nr:pretranslocase SecA subunit-like domain protein [Orientia tsutsugamushi str. UT76]
MNTDDGMLPLSDDEFTSLENINPQELDKDLSLDEIIQEILINSGKIHDLATRGILKDKFKG